MSGSLDSDLHLAVCESELDISCAKPQPVLESSGDDRALEDKFRELLSTLAAHPDHGPSRASPHAVPCSFEAAGQELTDFLGCLG
jgi:hypothetical protein